MTVSAVATSSARSAPAQCKTDEANRLICRCMNVTRSAIRHVITTTGASSVAEIERATGACAGCGACRLRLGRMVEGNERPIGPCAFCVSCGQIGKLCECFAGS